MKVSLAPRKASARAKTGASLLTNAQAVNTRPVKGRLNAFAEAHRNYCEAQSKVDAAENAVQEQQALISGLDAKLEDSVTALARSLINSGQPFVNAFSGLGSFGPGAIKSLPPGEAAGAVHELVIAVRRSPSSSGETRSAADAAELAAQQVEAAVEALATGAAALHAARGLRDTYAQSWDAKLADLRLAVRSAEREVPGLHAALFGRPTRPAKKTTAAVKQPTAPVTASVPAAPVNA